MGMSGVPSSEFEIEESINTRWVLKEQGEDVKGRFVIKHFRRLEDESNVFFTATPTPVSFTLGLAPAAWL